MFREGNQNTWVDELEIGNKLTQPLAGQRFAVGPEIPDQDMVALQVQDESLAPIIEWFNTGHMPYGI